MSRSLILCILPLFLLTACRADEGDSEDPQAPVHAGDATASASPQGENTSEVAFQLPERDLFPEGIAYDPVTESFFIGSLRKSKIIRIDGQGRVDTLLARDQLGPGGILGMRVDPQRRILWANFHQAGEQLGADPSVPFRTGIHKIDLESGTLIKSYSLEKPDDNFLLNDIALAPDGTVFMTSYSGGTLYSIPSETDELEAWLPMPQGVYTNGITMDPEGRFLFVAGNDQIYRVAMESREVIRMAQPEGDSVGFGDGLYFHHGGLVIIASYGEQGRRDYHVAWLPLSQDLSTIEEMRVLDQAHPLYGYPTTGALVDGWFYYIGNAQFDRIDAQGTVAPWDELSDTYVLKVEIEGIS